MKLESSITIQAPIDRVFDEICNVEARAKDLPAFRRVEIRDRSPSGFIATMYEHYGERDVVVTSQFTFQRPDWVTYEHLESPYGQNRGRFSLTAVADSTRVDQVHETEQDISEGTPLRGEWVALTQQQLEAIRKACEAGD